MSRAAGTVAAIWLAWSLGAVPTVSAQTSLGSPRPRAWGRVSFFGDTSLVDIDGREGRTSNELVTTFTYQAPDGDDNGLEYGVDARRAGINSSTRPSRTSIYEGFVGGRVASGHLRVRGGHLWLSDVGALGSLAGVHVEARPGSGSTSGAGRLRVGAFGGLEPRVYETGYVPGVKKFGGYVALDGEGARRHVGGYVTVRHASIEERSVFTFTNYVPVGRRFFLYQATEYDLQPPAGQGARGLSYFFANARVSPANRLELQGTYNRGRSIDARGLADDVLNGRPLNQTAIAGLAYESIGGRATVEVVRRARVYAGYSRDKTNRTDAQTGRALVGGYAPNLGGMGLDLSASDSWIDRGDGSTYHSRYISLGRQIGRAAYVSGDYSTSLSVVRFSRSDGLVIEQRPRTTRMSGTTTINIGRATSLHGTVDRTQDEGMRELRVLTGISYRFR